MSRDTDERAIWGPDTGGDAGSHERDRTSQRPAERPRRGTVAAAIVEANPLRRNVAVGLVAALVATLVIAAFVSRDGGGGSDEGAGVTTTVPPTPTTAVDPVAATVVFDDGTTVEVQRALVETLTELILEHERFPALSFENPSENRVRTRVTRNLVLAEIARHVSPEPVDPEVLALVRDEQVQQVLFELTLLDEEEAATTSQRIIEQMAPYVDILAETIARQSRTPGIQAMLEGVTVLVDVDIGVWDPDAIDVFG